MTGNLRLVKCDGLILLQPMVCTSLSQHSGFQLESTEVSTVKFLACLYHE